MDRLAMRGRHLWDWRLRSRKTAKGLLQNLGRFKGELEAWRVLSHLRGHFQEEALTTVGASASHTGSLESTLPLEHLPSGNLLRQTSALLQRNQDSQHCFYSRFFFRALHSNSGPKEIGTGHPARETPTKKSKKGGNQETLDRLQKVKWALYERRLPPELRNRDDIIKVRSSHCQRKQQVVNWLAAVNNMALLGQ